MTNKIKEHIGFQYLLTKIQLCTLILLESNIPQEVLSKIKDKSITYNIFRIQDDGSIMYGFYCIAFIEYVIAGKTFLDYTNLFSSTEYKKNGKKIYKYFKDKYDKKCRKS